MTLRIPLPRLVWRRTLLSPAFLPATVLGRFVLVLAALFPFSLDAAQADDDFPALDCVLNPNEVVDVSSPVPGVVDEVLVERSDYVSKGQVVARLAAGVEKAGVELARARARLDPEINAGEVNLAYDKKRKERIDSLYGKKVVSAENKEDAEREAQLSVWRLQQAMDLKRVREYELKRAEELLAQKTIKATIDGFVVQRFKSKGEYVEDQPIVRVAQLDPLRVEAIVPMQYFGAIKPGMRARVHPESDAGGHEASVTVVDPVGDPGSGTFGVRLEMPNPDFSIPAGSRCEMKFIAGSAPDPDAPLLSRQASGRETSPEQDTVVSRSEGNAADVPDSSSMVSPQVEHLSLGPFRTEKELGNARDTLARDGIDYQVREEDVADNVSMVLAVSPEGDALEDLLNARGIKDYIIVRSSPWEGRISLGVFSATANAMRRKSQLEAEGVTAEVVEKPLVTSRYWLDVVAGDEAVVDKLSELAQGGIGLVRNREGS
ncbi:MAG: efflux RND transporter periplasmic adaptor subunit [Pseudomonadales bacterium]|nr:efflux RND transporter periplasmic adaptor subunit [Pseudomonadales bacterium]